MPQTTERHFEEAIEAWLLDHAGYTKAENTQFDAALALDKTTLLAFIKETQLDRYDALKTSYGATVDEQLIKRIASECDSRGLLDVLRKGFRDRGQELKLAYFRPPTALNPETEHCYKQNRLTVMRQVYYDLNSKNSIDMLLSLNGLPIITVELKNAFTGQKSINAILQYIKDRVPTSKTPLIQYKKRALVHFAVDTDEAYMCTKLAGNKSYFLPFNTGNKGGKGNSDDHKYATGYKTGYLWEKVWQKDSLLDIIHRFVHLQVEETSDLISGKKRKKETLIFPRYHQLDATRKLISATKQNGVGTNYLIQHSAGSGKTNTISWTAHQLATLHDKNDKPVYNTVVVISDRRNLDKQLQDSIYQIDHKKGVVARIDEDKHASDLADELNKGTKIIITTLQKFSFLMGKVDDLSNKRFAVIVDEAHSSQGNKHSGNLNKVLGAHTDSLDDAKILAVSESEDAKGVEALSMEDLILEEAKRRGKQVNISFYAFTATPKHKTLEMFGLKDESGYPHPFHLYSMRQAIEEEFILDVLKHYTTYKTYYKLSKAIDDDPEVDEKKAKRAIARFMSLHPHNIAQKTEIMIEHFRRFTLNKIGGHAKAMLVTRSRLHAVKYKQAFDAYIKEKQYTDVKTLVAFSGTVEDPEIKDISYTEPGMNSFSEKELPKRFGSDEYQVLIVAEKYQTGFDQPLLHTMFVDKKLGDLKAVQTLSRLNRTRAGKTDTFVLDFANEIEDIKEAFIPYYEQTEIDEPTDPNILYTIHSKLNEAPVLRVEDIDVFAKVYFKPEAQQNKRDHGQLNKWIDPAVERYKNEYRDTSKVGEVYTDEGEEFKSTLQSFVRIYGYLSQIISWQDVDLEKLYAYGRYLLMKLPYRDSDGMMKLHGEVELASYRNEQTFKGSGQLTLGEALPLYGPSEVGTGGQYDDAKTPLSVIIEVINERFGTDWKDNDKLLFEQISRDMVNDENLSEKARANTMDQFRPVFETEVLKAFVNRQDRNESIVNLFMSNEEARNTIINALLVEVYEKMKTG